MPGRGARSGSSEPRPEFYLQVFNLYNRRNEWFIQYHPEDSEKEPTVVRMLPVLPTFGFDFRF